MFPLQQWVRDAQKSGGIGFEKGGGALTQNFQINGFWPAFYIKKS